jgi:hypothetical protein
MPCVHGSVQDSVAIAPSVGAQANWSSLGTSVVIRRSRAPNGLIYVKAPLSLRLPPKISKTTPCKVAAGRRNRRFELILDPSGKSAALLHDRKIR